MATRRSETNANRNTTSSANSTTNNEDRSEFNASGTGHSVKEVNTGNENQERALTHQIASEHAKILAQIRDNFQLNSNLIEWLIKLYEFEIVFVCDDSTSMKKLINGTENTRWSELCGIVKRLLPITLMFDGNGVDIHFLNREKYCKVKSTAEVDYAFEKPPNGYTSLVPVLRDIFQSGMARTGREKKLLVLVATDGRPTNENGDDDENAVNELKHLMQDTRNKETTYVSFLLCTDEQECVDYLARWDRTMENVDVTDDYNTERAKILECQKNNNFVFTEDDYIVKALVGSIIPRIDRLNERKVTSADK